MADGRFGWRYERDMDSVYSFTAEEERLRHLAEAHPIISEVLKRWSAIRLPDAWISGSIIAQARWNESFGFDPMHGIADVDLVYFDPEDVSETTEIETSDRISEIFDDLSVKIDTKNQARVHEWYASKFGYSIAPYRSAVAAIATFPTTAAAVGIRHENGLQIFAPFGLSDLLEPLVRANATQITEEIYSAKAARWSEKWPALEIRPWSDAVRLQVE